MHSSKIEEFASMSEVEFTMKVVIPLFEELGYRGVRYTHGIEEYGMDVVCYEINRFDVKRYVGIQVKKGDIGGTRKTQDIIAQAKASFSIPYLDISSQIEYKISELYVVASGKITGYAKKHIYNALTSFGGVIKFLDREYIIDILYRNKPKETEIDFFNYFELFFNKLNEKYNVLCARARTKNIG